jgi:hypothetical protein
LAGVAVFAVLQLGLGLASELYPRIRDPFYGDKLVKLRAKLAAAHGRPCIVMLGTSRTGFGFHGTRIEQRIRKAGGRDVAAFNYGIPASGPVTHLIYTQRLFRDGVVPDLLLVEVLPSMLADRVEGPLEGLWVFGERLTYRELDTAARFGFPEEVRSQWRAATFNPWYTLRFQLLSRVVQSWVPWQLRYDWSRGSDESGWGTYPRNDITPQELAEGHKRAYLEYAPVLSDLRPGGHAGAALLELLSECQSRGVLVKLVLMPESAIFQSWYPPHVRKRLDEYLRKVCIESGCTLIDARNWVADDAFTDGHHLLRSGAEAFADRLADEVLLPWLAAGGGP